MENALKYSPRGDSVTIAAHHLPETQLLVLSVSDRGIGISPEDRDRIFLLGERVACRKTDNVGGAGLGLFIVKELVELMGGEVWVESELNKGSSFFFSIPTRRTDVLEGAWETARRPGGANVEKGAAA